MKRIHREHYEKLLMSYVGTSDIKVVSGVRRCGKSTLVAMLVDQMVEGGISPQNIYYRRLDDFDVPLQPTAGWLRSEILEALEGSVPGEQFHVVLDEVQDVQGWEELVRRLHARPGTDVFITGSNAYTLSSDLATLLGGRHVQLSVFPLSFAEYLVFAQERDAGQRPIDQLLAEYLRYGGMPGLFELRAWSQEWVARQLEGVFNTIIVKDVARHARIRDIELLERVVRYVFSTSGRLFSTNKVVGALTSMGRKTSSETVDGYLHALGEALVLSACEQEGLQGKELLRPNCKYYPVDTGLRNLMTGFSGADLGFQLECAVHNELLRRGCSVSVGTLRAGEVDFVAKCAGGREYIQVTESLVGEEVRERELKPLRALTDAFPKTVLTLDRFTPGVTEDGINIVSIADWLLSA